jgi:hypothetical protein
MSFRLPSGCGFALAALGLGGLLLCRASAQDKPKGQEPEFSEHNSGAVTTNLLQLGTGRNGLRQLEDEVDRSFQTFSPKSSLEGALAPPMRPVLPPSSPAQNKRLREMRERQQQWIFMTPEELAAPPGAEDLLNLPEYGPDGKEKVKLSPMDRFYENLLYPQANGKKSNKEKDPLGPSKRFGKDDDEANSLNDALPGGISESERALKKLLGLDPARSAPTPAPARNPFSDIFHLGDPGRSAEDLKAHVEYMKQFQTLLDGPPPASSLEPVNPLAGAADSARTAASPSAGLPRSSSRPDGYDPMLGAVSPTYIPNGPGDFNSKLLNQWNPNYTPPKSAPPQVAPPTPNFTPPRRAF